MYDQLRPPTDNLYKFLALAGLTVAIFAGYMNGTRDIKLLTLESQSDDADDAIERLKDRYTDDLWRIENDLQDKRIDAATATKRKAVIVKRRQDGIERYDKESRESRLAAKKLFHETYYQYWTLVYIGWIGALFGLVGFVLWYLRLQRPLDEIMRYDLDERRRKANDQRTAG
jgi:hypothetical protein